MCVKVLNIKYKQEKYKIDNLLAFDRKDINNNNC